MLTKYEMLFKTDTVCQKADICQKPNAKECKHGARSIRPKFRPVRPKKEDHLKRWTRFFETFPVGPNRSIEFWTKISGKFGWMDRAHDLSFNLPAGGVRHDPQRFMGKTVTVPHFNRDTVEFASRIKRGESNPGIKTLLPFRKRAIWRVFKIS